MPTASAAARISLEEIMARRDAQDTKLAENHYQRLKAQSQARTLPYQEEADIAQEQANAARGGSAVRLNPLVEEAGRGRLESDIRTAPLAEEAQIAELERKASGEDQLRRDGINPLAYQFHLRDALRETEEKGIRLPDKELKRIARNQALRLNNDAPLVSAVEEEAFESQSPEIRKKYLHDYMDPETGARFTRIKDDADPAEVNALLRKHTYNRQRAAQDREERMAAKDYNTIRLRALMDRRDAVNELAKFGDEAAKAKLIIIDEEIDKIAVPAKAAPVQPPPVSGAKDTPATPSAPAKPANPIRQLWK